MLCKLDWSLWDVRDSQAKYWEFGVAESADFHWLEVEALRKDRENHLQSHLSKRLPEADSFASVEGQPASLRALFAIRSQRIGVARVKAIRIESFRFLPVRRVVVHWPEIDQHGIECFHFESTNGHISLKLKMRAGCSW